MKHPAIATIPRCVFTASLFAFGGAAVSLCLRSLTSIKTGVLLLQGAVSGILLCVMVILMWYAVRYTKMSDRSTFEIFLKNVAILILSISIWIGCDYLIFFILFPKEVFNALASLISLKAVFGIFVTISSILYSDRLEPEEDEFSNDEAFPEIQDTANNSSASSENHDDNDTSNNEIIEKVVVKSGSKINIIKVAEILYLQAEGDYVIIYNENSRFIKEETMKNLESQLPPYFIRVHRSFIVNTNYISRIELYEKQRYNITLKNGQQIKASISGYKILKEYLKL